MILIKCYYRIAIWLGDVSNALVLVRDAVLVQYSTKILQGLMYLQLAVFAFTLCDGCRFDAAPRG